MQIRAKIMIAFLTVVLFTSMLLTAIWYSHSVDMVNTYIKDISDSVMTDAYTAFDYVLTDTSYMITLMSTNKENIITPIKNINQVKLDSSGQLDFAYLENRRIIKSYLSSMNGYKYYVVALGVASVNGHVFQTSNIVQNKDALYKMVEDVDVEILKNSMIMLPPMKTTNTWFNMKSNFVVPAVRGIIDEQQNIIGYTFLYFDYSVIEDMFSNNLPDESMFQVVDDDGNLIYSNLGVAE